MNFFFRPKRERDAVAELRDGYIELGTRLILLENIVSQPRRVTREIRKDAAVYEQAKAAKVRELQAFTGIQRDAGRGAK